MLITAHKTITFWKTREAAAKIADLNSDADPDWSYKIEEWSGGFVVVVRDETGFDLGTL